MAVNAPGEWSPSTWRNKPIVQDVVYPPDTADKLPEVREKLRALPGLVSPEEIERLRTQLAKVSRGEAFLLQGGDCAELFQYCTHSQIAARLRLMLLMSLVIIWGARVPVIRVGRLAGQYAKPRSKSTEIIDGVEHLSFRGDNVNGFALNERTPDPERLLQAYFHSAATLNHIRSLLSSGFADLHRPKEWRFAHVRSPELQKHFTEIADRLEDALGFMKTIGASGDGLGALEEVDLWSSHEALMLEYEEALTRPAPTPSFSVTPDSSRAPSPPLGGADGSPTPAAASPQQHHYATSAAFLWVGDRTRQPTHAHLEYLRGLRNPLGVKVGPTMSPKELLEVLDIVDPGCEEGRVTLICRYGAEKVEGCLESHIKAVQGSNHKVVWACDPMHGNTKNASGGVKTRHMADIVSELTASLRIHSACGSRLNGAHLEMTGDVDEDGFSVTECIGGSMALQDADLKLRYQSYCDPRLNYEQSLDVAFLISNYARNVRMGLKGEDAVARALAGRVQM